MYQYIFQILFYILNPQYFSNIDQKNQFKTQFKNYYETKQYKKATEAFEILDKTTRIIDPELRIDAAQAYFKIKDFKNAKENYLKLQDLTNKPQSALVFNQLGLIACFQKDSTAALKYFVKSIENDPSINTARYNYEFIKKVYNPKSFIPPVSQTIAQNKQIVASDKKEALLDEYKSKKISKDKALQLLENLRISEQIYLKPAKNTSQKDTKDW